MEQSEEIPAALRCTDSDCMAMPHYRGATGCVDEDILQTATVVTENMDAGEAARRIRESNEARCRNLEAKSGGQVNLENAFDALKMIVMLENICAELDISDTTGLDFEGRRAEMLDKIEQQYEQMFEAREAARRQQVLAGGMDPRRVPPPGAGPRIVRPR
jgi:hypothetical protein